MEKAKLSMKHLGIDKAEITEDLSKYYRIVYQDSRYRAIIESEYESVEDYVNILYWIKFVKKLDYHQMGELTGRPNFYQVYMKTRFFWHYNVDSLKQCEEMHKKEFLLLQEKQQKAKDFLEQDMPPEYFKTIKDFDEGKLNISDFLLLQYGQETAEYFIKEIIYLRYIENLTTREFSILYNKATNTISYLLKKLNCGISLKEAQQRVVEKGRRDYAKSFKTRRKTLVKNALEHGLTGSNEENICRLMIADELIALIGAERFEIVVGIADRSIIAPAEIDIPIMVFDKLSGTVKKYAVEYNGDVWHEKRRGADKEKETKLNGLGWKYFALEFHSNSGNVTNRFIKTVSEFCELLAKDILKR